MKTLYLVRHAKSSWEYDLDDFDRPLNDRGFRDAPMMGEILAEKQLKPDIMISSPASRAIRTASLLAEALRYTAPVATLTSLYHASPAILLDVVKSLDDQISICLLTGHNPWLTSFANQLGDKVADNIPTCGIYAIRFSVKNWSDVTTKKGETILFDFPKNHR